MIRVPRRNSIRWSGCSFWAALKSARASGAFNARASTRSGERPSWSQSSIRYGSFSFSAAGCLSAQALLFARSSRTSVAARGNVLRSMLRTMPTSDNTILVTQRDLSVREFPGGRIISGIEKRRVSLAFPWQQRGAIEMTRVGGAPSGLSPAI
jgi:hypothetical protein